MARRIKDDTPAGGWLGPRMADARGNIGPTGPAQRIAVGVTKGNKWIWKDATPEVLAAVAAKREKEARNAERSRRMGRG